MTARFWDEVLAETAAREPDTAAYVDASGGAGTESRTVSYGELARWARTWTRHLRSLGVGRGDVVCLLLANSPEYPACYAGAAGAGAITSGLNLRLGPGEIRSVVARSEPAVSVVEDGLAPPPGSGIVVTRGELAALFAERGTPDHDVTAPTTRDPGDAVAIVWTSGTTGVPKGACYTHAAVGALAVSDTALGRHHDRCLAAIPQAHVGFMTKVWAHAARATTQVVAPPRWDPETTLHLLERFAVTVAGGVPPQWRMLLDSPRFDTTDLGAVRQVVLGGASIEASLVHEIRERVGVPVVVRYTCTELGGTCSTVPGDRDEVVAGTVGRPLGGVEVDLVDERRVPVPGGEVGEIRSRSAAMMSGYWRDPELTAQSIDADGWFYTGDLGRVRADGNLEIAGRRKDMYIRGGYNVYPVEVEHRLAAHPDVHAAAVVGVHDPRLGEIGVACVVPADAASPPRLADLRDWVGAELAGYKRPDRLLLVDSLPLTSLHKPDKAALADLALESSPPARD